MDKRLIAGVGIGIGGLLAYLFTRKAKAVPPEELPPVTPPPGQPRITTATFQTSYNTYGGFYGQLVKATITVDSPRDFTGELKISLPGEIAGTPLINHAQLAQRDLTTIVQVDKEGEFYIGTSYSSHQKAVIYGHYSKLMQARDSVSHTVNFPIGTSQFAIAFFLVPDYFRYSYSSGELNWIDEPYYLPAVHSPMVELYEDSSLLYRKVFADAIQVEPWGPYPVSVDIPAMIASGGEAWAGFTMFLPYKGDCDYEVYLYVKEPNVWNLAFGEVVDAKWYVKKDNWYMGGAQSISTDGVFSFEGLVGYDKATGTYIQVPAMAIYDASRFKRDIPVPPGRYKVYMRCNLKFVAYATNTATKYSSGGLIWKDVEVGEIEVV